MDHEKKDKTEKKSKKRNPQKYSKKRNSSIPRWEEEYFDSQVERAQDFANEQERRNADFRRLKNDLAVKATTEIKNLQKNGIEHLERVKTGLNTKIENLQNNGTAHLESVKAAFDTEIERLRADAKEKHQEILNLYGLVGKDSVTAGYTKTMEAEQKRAAFWRKVAIGFIIMTALWVVCAYIWGNDDVVLLKGAQYFSVAGVLLFGAVYSARQSALHRKEETRTRWFALEVGALDPFIKSLDEADQKALKVKLSERLFGQNQRTEKNTPLINKAGARMILKGLRDILKIK